MHIDPKEKRKLLRKKNVVAVGYGNKFIDGVDTGESCISVLVEKKLSKKELTRSALVPQEVSGIKTDIIESGKIKALGRNTALAKARALKDRTDRIRPAMGGVSVGHSKITAGTLGCLVTDGTETYILSNNHVLANCNSAKKGDGILQPGPHDGGTMVTNTIARLDRFEPIRFSRGDEFYGFFGYLRRLFCTIFGIGCPKEKGPNYFDAAIATIITGTSKMATSDILEIGPPAGAASGERYGLEIKKSGRTTGLTTGRVTQTGADVIVDYGAEHGEVLFENQIISDMHSQGGDSGSAVLNNDNQVVGLLFAGSDTITILSPITPILNTFGVDILS